MLRRMIVLFVTLLVGLGATFASTAPAHAQQHVDNPAQAPMKP
jgi:hypothetical protein